MLRARTTTTTTTITVTTIAVVSALLLGAGCGGIEGDLQVQETTAAKTSPLISFNLCKSAGKRWDFETGLQGWTKTSGNAFNNQPTYGENISTWRVRKAELSPDGLAPSFKTNIDNVGGDYWDVPYPIGIQGDHWIGTYENRPTASHPWAKQQGDIPMGTLVSPEVAYNPLCHKYIHFLIGGGCNVSTLRIEVQVKPLGVPTWQSLPTSRRTGTCIKANAPDERMKRVVIPTSTLGIQAGASIKLVIYDLSPFGHINIDDVQITNTYPSDLNKTKPVWGMADTHTHPAAQFAYGSHGGRLIAGHTNDLDAKGKINNPFTCNGTGHSPYNGLSGSAIIRVLEDQHLYGDTLSQFAHIVNPTPVSHVARGVYNSAWHSLTHQQMYEKWIRRAYDGGLRLLVAEAYNNRMLDWATWQATAFAGPSDTDMESVDRQITAIKEMINRNSDWMALALSPSHAREIINQNKLAVILGVEVDSFADCDIKSLPNTLYGVTFHAGTNGCVADFVKILDDLYKQGVRQLHPTHLTDNGFGGTALYNDLFNTVNHYLNADFFDVAPSATDVHYKLNDLQMIAANFTFTKGLVPYPVQSYNTTNGHVNYRGITPKGVTLIQEMMKRGMIIAADHMSERMLDQVLGLPNPQGSSAPLVADPSCPYLDDNHPQCYEKAYPVAITHMMPRDLQYNFAETKAKGKHKSEIAKRKDQIEQVYKLGGIVSPGLGGDIRGQHSSVANTCANTSRSFAQTYQYLMSLQQNLGLDEPSIPIGTDANGLNGMPNPRYGIHGCWLRSGHASNQSVNDMGSANLATDYQQRTQQLASPAVNYKHYNATQGSQVWHWTALGGSQLKKHQLWLPMEPAYYQTPLKAAQTSVTSPAWDINTQGMAHYGMMPDYFQDLRAVGMKKEELKPAFKGAEAYIRMWEKACKLSNSSVNGPGCS